MTQTPFFQSTRTVRRRVVRALCIALAAAGLGHAALAQSASSKAESAAAPWSAARAVTIVAPASAGGTTDLAARMVATALAQATGLSVVVENKAGGNGAIAVQQVKRAAADGATLLMQYSGFHVISPHLSDTRSWQLGELRGVANVLSAPQIVVVRADLGVNTMAELVALAKKRPGALNYASSGNGSLQHVTGTMLEQTAGITLTHIPYKGTGPALQDLLGGRVEMTFGTAPPFMPHIQNGTLKVLAVTGAQRLSSLPDVPTTAEAGYPGLDATSWFALFAPATTSDAMVEHMARRVGEVVQTSEFMQKARDQGAAVDFVGPAELDARVKAEDARWARIVKDANMKN